MKLFQGNYEHFARKSTKSKSPNSVSDESYTKMVKNDNELKRKHQIEKEKFKKQLDNPSDIFDKSLKNISKKIDNSNNKVKSQTSKLPTEIFSSMANLTISLTFKNIKTTD